MSEKNPTRAARCLIDSLIEVGQTKLNQRLAEIPEKLTDKASKGILSEHKQRLSVNESINMLYEFKYTFPPVCRTDSDGPSQSNSCESGYCVYQSVISNIVENAINNQSASNSEAG